MDDIEFTEDLPLEPFFWDIMQGKERNIASFLLWPHDDLCVQRVYDLKKRHKEAVNRYNNILYGVDRI